jgi:hypothetical protein
MSEAVRSSAEGKFDLEATPGPDEGKPCHGRNALKAAALGAAINLRPLPRQPDPERPWEGGPVRWRRRAPEPILRAVTRLNGPRLASLTALGVTAVAWLSFAYWPMRTAKGGATALDDVMAAMPGFADYALVVMVMALMLALLNTVYGALYWPMRVRINRSGQYMTSLDQYGLELAAMPFRIAILALCFLLYMWLSGRLGVSV